MTEHHLCSSRAQGWILTELPLNGRMTLEGHPAFPPEPPLVPASLAAGRDLMTRIPAAYNRIVDDDPMRAGHKEGTR